MNFGTIGGFVKRNGKGILAKSAVAVGLIAGLAFLSDDPGEDDEMILVDGEETTEEVVETTAVDVTEGTT